MSILKKLQEVITKSVNALLSLTHSDRSPISIWNKTTPRILVTSLRGFQEDACGEKAAALTYYSLLAVIPALAIAFGVAEGFGLGARLELAMNSLLADHPAIANKVIELIHNYLEKAKGSVIAGIGVIALLWTAIILLRRIEEALNAIWKTEKHRPFLRMITDYSAVIIFFPIFLVISSSISVYVISFIKKATEEKIIVDTFNVFGFIFWYLVPLCVSWLLFTMLYVLMPNTRVSFLYSFIGGVIAGSLYQITQWAYIHSQVTISHYGAIYGTLAAIPLFFIWVNISWNIALLGAEIAFHGGADAKESFVRKAQQEDRVEVTKIQLMLYLLYSCVKRFEKHETPLTPRLFSEDLGISYEISSALFKRLKTIGLLARLYNNGEEEYIPALPSHDMTIKTVLESLISESAGMTTVNHRNEFNTLHTCLDNFMQDAEKSHNNIPLSRL